MCIPDLPVVSVLHCDRIDCGIDYEAAAYLEGRGSCEEHRLFSAEIVPGTTGKGSMF